MEEQALKDMAASFCGQAKNFVTTLHSNTAQLRASISHKPPAYGDLSSFLLHVNDRVAEDGAQMDLLQEMTVENVTFEELLAHSMELYKQNESSISSLESHLEQYGYSKERHRAMNASNNEQGEFWTYAGENAAGAEGKQSLDTSFVEGLKQRVRAKESSPKRSPESRENLMATPTAELLSSSNSFGRSYAQFESNQSSGSRGRLQSNLSSGSYQSPLPSALAQEKLDSEDLSKLGDSFSLEDFGISASSLASLAMAGADPITPDPMTPIGKKQEGTSAEAPSEHCSDDMDESCGSSPPSSPSQKGSEEPSGIKSQSSTSFLRLVSSEEYNQVQSWLRQRVSLEELNEIIGKINDAFQTKQSETVGSANIDGKSLELEESFLLGFGTKMKSGLLILVQIDKLVVVPHNSCSYYRPSELAKFR